MFDFGINGYQPQWLEDLHAVQAAHGDRLRRLNGRRLTRTWMVWESGADEWFCDSPVLLDFQGEQIEINHQKLTELSITWNSIDPAQKPSWPTDDDFRLTWRDDAVRELVALRGQTLDAVNLPEWDGGLADGTVALNFVLSEAALTVYNALDENGLIFTDPGPDWRRHPML